MNPVQDFFDRLAAQRAAQRAVRTGRVCHLSTAHPPRDNRIFNKECSALAAEGVDTWLVVAQDGDVDDNGVHTVGIGIPRGRVQRFLNAQVWAWQALDRVQPDLVHVHDPECIPTVLLWKTLHGRAAIYDSHEDLVGQMVDKDYLNALVKPLATLYAKVLMRLADTTFDGIVAATPTIAGKFTNRNKAIVRNFPWLSQYPAVADRTPVRGRAVYVGMLSSGRQVDVMAATVRAVPGASLVAAGPLDDDVAKDYTNLPEDDPISYIGRVPASEVPALVATGEVGLVFLKPLPNYTESLPTKLFEYMAAKVPFIATDIAYWRQLIESYDAGLFVDTSSTEEPVQALSELLADPARCRAMGERGRRALESEFNFEADVQTLVDVTDRALHRVRRTVVAGRSPAASPA